MASLLRLSTLRAASCLRPTAAAALSTTFVRTKATLPGIPYDYNALEPYISAMIMELHHSKHHLTHVSGLNAALDTIAEAESTGDARKAAKAEPLLKFHGGGHINHSLFWENLAPASRDGGGEPPGALKTTIQRDFGSTEALIKQLNAALAGIQGSGWAWLAKDATGTLTLVTRANQDAIAGGLIPLLGIDAWEHAYYLQYENRKAEYFSAIWNVVSWKTAGQRFDKA